MTVVVVIDSGVVLEQVKDYLGITVSTYDTQINMIATAWTAILNAQILPDYLADTAMAGILDSGKLLCIAGQVQAGIPTEAFGEPQSFDVGGYKETNKVDAARVGTDTPLFKQGLALLSPYMLSDGVKLSDVAVSSTGDYAPDFQLDRHDSEGNAIVQGNMQVV